MSDLKLALILTGDNAKLLPALKQSEQAVGKFTAATEAATQANRRNAKEGDKGAKGVKAQSIAVDSFATGAQAQYAQLELAVRAYVQSLQEGGMVIASNGVVTDKLGKANQQATEQLKLLTQAQKKHAGAARSNLGMMGNLRGMAQQFGYQVQDVAVQLQMGTNAMMVFGQQGSQLLGILGPAGALAGGVVAVGAALATAFVPSLMDSSDQVETLTDKLQELAKASTLTREQAAVLVEQEEQAIKTAKEQITTHQEQIDQLKAQQHNQALVIGNYDKGSKTYQKLEAAQRKAAKALAQGTAALQLQQGAIEEAERRKRVWNATTEKSIQAQEKERKTGEEGAKAAIRYQAELRQALIATDLAEAQLRAQSANRVATALDQQLAMVKRASSTELELRKEQYQQQADALENLYIHGRVTQEEFDTWSRRLDESYARDKQRLMQEQAGWQGQLLQSLKEAQRGVGDLFEDQVSRFSEGMGRAFESALIDSKSLGDGVQSIFEGMARSMVAFFGEWATQRLAQWVLEKTLGSAENAGYIASVGGRGAAETQLGALAAAASTAAIPIIGPALAPGAAAVFEGFGAGLTAAAVGAASAAFAGAFDKGGYIPAGQWGIMSEFGPELYNGVPVMGPATITSREETAKLLGGQSIHNSQHTTVMAMDAKSFDKWSRRNASSFDRAQRRARRKQGLRSF
ncbi:hypothetical protein [Ferrimonas sp.]|uniref:hypothetical protein n=1 Tax=Ferrimonas sp. TaxID=2080861 RepID=UPI003A8FF3ED